MIRANQHELILDHLVYSDFSSMWEEFPPPLPLTSVSTTVDREECHRNSLYLNRTHRTEGSSDESPVREGVERGMRSFSGVRPFTTELSPEWFLWSDNGGSPPQSLSVCSMNVRSVTPFRTLSGGCPRDAHSDRWWTLRTYYKERLRKGTETLGDDFNIPKKE